MNRKDIGAFILSERTKQKLSQRGLAEKAGLSRRQQIMEMETAAVDYGVEVLIKVLNALGYKPVFTAISKKDFSTLLAGDEPIQFTIDFSKVQSAKEEPETVGKLKTIPLSFKRKK